MNVCYLYDVKKVRKMFLTGLFLKLSQEERDAV